MYTPRPLNNQQRSFLIAGVFHSRTVSTVKGSLLSFPVNERRCKRLQSARRLLVFSQRPNKPDDFISCLVKHLQSVLKNNILKPASCVIVCRPTSILLSFFFLCAATNSCGSVKKCKIAGICASELVHV